MYKIIICPSPARDYDKRRWDKFAYLADNIIESYGSVIFVGMADQWDYVEQIRRGMRHKQESINICGRLSWGELVRLLSESRLVITVNTATMHLAVAMEVPTVAVIGGTPAYIVAPRNCKNFRYVENVDHINDITVEDVMEKIRELINKGQLDERAAGLLP